MSTQLVDGTYDPAFSPMVEAMEKWLSQDEEYGGAISMVHEGKTVIDLWGGYKDKERTQKWQKETVVCMMSVAKGFGSLCVLALADRGLLDLDKPVAKYWPAFGKNGKDKVLVRHVLSHLAGIPFLDHAPEKAGMDIEAIFKAMEDQEPVWTPGVTPGYHTFLHGYFCAALVQKVINKPIAQFWREDVAGPFEADFYFNCPEDVWERASPLYIDDDDPMVDWSSDLENPIGRSWQHFPARIPQINTAPEWRNWGIPSIGFGNARGVARLAGAMANEGTAFGQTLLSPEMVNAIMQVQWDDIDATLGVPMRHGLGFIMSNDVFPMTGGPRAFGTIGHGGAMAVADPDLNIGFGFSPNHASSAMGENPHLANLLKAALDCL